MSSGPLSVTELIRMAQEEEARRQLTHTPPPPLPPFVQELGQNVVTKLGEFSQPISLEDLKRMPGVLATALAHGAVRSADFFLGGPIVSTEQIAPAFGLGPLPPFPSVTGTLEKAGIISPEYLPRDARENLLAGMGELGGLGCEPGGVGA